ncbi:MAG: PAS domain S-box protein [Caldilineaceae bacterium]
MDQINRAIQGANDLEQMLGGVLDALRAIFQCDRVGLLYPCEPQAATWQTVMECAQAGCAGSLPAQPDIPMNPHLAHLFRTLAQADAPVQFTPASASQSTAAMMSYFQVQSTLAIAIFSKADQPYALGLHQCAGPRGWTQPEAALLHEAGQRLADAITHWQEVRRLRECERRLDDIQRIAHVAYWGRDLDTNRSMLSDEVYHIFGLPQDSRFDRLDVWQEKWTQMIHPEDRLWATKAKDTAQRNGASYEMEYRIVRPDGEIRVVNVQGDVALDKEGHTHRMIGIVQDITKIRQVEEDLRASESRFRALVEHAADAVFLHGPRGVILDVNQQACWNLGYNRDELLGMSPIDYDIEITVDELVQLEMQLHAGQTVTFETRHRRKDGSIFPVEVRARAVGPADPGVAVTLVRDISERKRAEAALRESEERYRTLFEDSPSMYFTVEGDGTVSSVNRFGAAQLGYTEAELIGRSVLDVFHVEDRARALEAVRQCIAEPGKLFHWSLRKICKDGSLMWVEETARATPRADGCIMVLIVCEDITERKRTEQALVENHNLLNAIIEGTTDVVFVKDLQGRYVMINSAGANFLGKSVEEIIGKDDRELFSTDTAPEVMANDQMVLAWEKSMIFEIKTTSVGGERTYLSTKGVLRDVHGEVYGLVGISRDITELKRLVTTKPRDGIVKSKETQTKNKCKAKVNAVK